jgi:CRP-like cAMP-binding protein
MDTELKIDYLRLEDVFRGLCQAEMDCPTLLNTCRRGKIVYRPEDTHEVLFILKKGRVQLYRLSPQGKKLGATTLGSGMVFGEMALIGQTMSNRFAEAVEDCLLCVMSRYDLEQSVLRKPTLALRLMQMMADRLSQAETRLKEWAFKRVPARLASLLLRLREEQGDHIYDYTHQDLAEAIGTYRETATQTLNEFKSQHLIEIGRRRIDILDAAGLERVAAE